MFHTPYTVSVTIHTLKFKLRIVFRIKTHVVDSEKFLLENILTLLTF